MTIHLGDGAGSKLVLQVRQIALCHLLSRDKFEYTVHVGKVHVQQSPLNSRSCQLRIDYLIPWQKMNEVCNGEQKEQKYLHFGIFYGGQKLHRYFRFLLIKVTSLLTCCSVSVNCVTAGNLNARINSSCLF